MEKWPRSDAAANHARGRKDLKGLIMGALMLESVDKINEIVLQLQTLPIMESP